MLSSTSEIKVRYAETDAMGIAYHGNYLTWFEVARTAIFDDIGIPYKTLESEGYFVPVLEAQVRYLAPARYDDVLHVTAMVREMPRARIKVEYAVWCDGRCITTGQTTHAFMNRAGQGIRPPKIFMEKIAEYFPEK